MRAGTRLLVVGALLTLAAGCTSGKVGPVPSATQTTRAWPVTEPFSASRCEPPSPTSRSEQGGLEVRGSGQGATLWGLVFASLPLPVGEDVKIVWRMTGSGELHVDAGRSDGTPAGRTFGPEPHPGSNWNRPGDEWGTGFVFPKAGCWHVRLVRGSGSGDVWLMAR